MYVSNFFEEKHKMSYTNKKVHTAEFPEHVDDLPKDRFSANPPKELPVVEEDEITDDSVLAFAQTQRLMLVKSMTAEGKMPEKNTDRLAFLQALNDMSSQAQANKRLKVDEGANAVNQQVLEIVAQLNQAQPRGPGYVKDIIPGEYRHVAPDDEIELIEIDPATVSSEVIQESSADFVKRVKGKE
jgi:hypothetical protein